MQRAFRQLQIRQIRCPIRDLQSYQDRAANNLSADMSLWCWDLRKVSGKKVFYRSMMAECLTAAYRIRRVALIDSEQIKQGFQIQNQTQKEQSAKRVGSQISSIMMKRALALACVIGHSQASDGGCCARYCDHKTPEHLTPEEQCCKAVICASPGWDR